MTDCQSGSNWRTLGSPLFGVPHQSALLLLPAAASLAAFAWLLTLHPFVAGRVYAAYGGRDFRCLCLPPRGPDSACVDQVREVGAFRQFNRAAHEQQGSGLGLSLVKGLIEASGGTFDLRSVPGEGTTVSASWPV